MQSYGSVSLNQGEVHSIQLEPNKTLLLDLFYNFSIHQLKVLREYINHTLANELIFLSTFSERA